MPLKPKETNKIYGSSRPHFGLASWKKRRQQARDWANKQHDAANARHKAEQEAEKQQHNCATSVLLQQKA